MKWQEIDPADARDIDLTDPDYANITAPLNEQGERCAWPWEPQLKAGQPMGQYHCGRCGAMVLAGYEHIDYSELPTIDQYIEKKGTNVELQWKEPPSYNMGNRRNGKYPWDDIIEALKSRPGEWALVIEGAPLSLAWQIRNNRTTPFATGKWESVCKANRAAGYAAGRGDLYVRYLGE